MSFETRKQDAAKMLQKWERANSGPAAQKRLIDDNERLWRMARDLAFALENLYNHAHSHSAQCQKPAPAEAADGQA